MKMKILSWFYLIIKFFNIMGALISSDNYLFE